MGKRQVALGSEVESTFDNLFGIIHRAHRKQVPLLLFAHGWLVASVAFYWFYGGPLFGFVKKKASLKTPFLFLYNTLVRFSAKRFCITRLNSFTCKVVAQGATIVVVLVAAALAGGEPFVEADAAVGEAART